jgi:hypothetical protein
MLERVVGIDQAVYGPAHPEIAVDLLELSSMHELLGDRTVEVAGRLAALEDR